MSRIHDALRRAEQLGKTDENPAMDVLAEMSEAAEVFPTPAPLPNLPPFQEEAMDAVLPASPLDERSGIGSHILTADTLERNCREAGWNPDKKAVLFQNPEYLHSIEHEQFRTLRSRLYQLRGTQNLKTILIGSALPAEGKTFVAVNLAHVIVRQQGRRVLLIDADLRHPRLHETLGAPVSPGLSDYLSGRVDEIAAMQRGPIENLFFMPGGSLAANPAEMIGNGRLTKLVNHIGPLFDWIIIDSPPAAPLTDASVIAGACDGVLLVVKAGATPFDIARKARDEFQAKALLGVVLNRAGVANSTYGSYYYGSYPKSQ